ncbi:hypothetical protein HPP92_001004 [Vanilla planifolia]|uniref:Saposin B-type domain-containing protein n=1 Tax=Vanilla planifolia TaxID=51239 RepID=A0A835VJA1_VANPL|nr:hypothetical protein HPP92_001004 [Vanilla planifolia]
MPFFLPQTVIAQLIMPLVRKVLSVECKQVVEQYGEMILDLLIAQTRPDKVCSKIGLCLFDGDQSTGIGIKSVLDKQNDDGSSSNDDLFCTALRDGCDMD